MAVGECSLPAIDIGSAAAAKKEGDAVYFQANNYALLRVIQGKL